MVSLVASVTFSNRSLDLITICSDFFRSVISKRMAKYRVGFFFLSKKGTIVVSAQKYDPSFFLFFNSPRHTFPNAIVFHKSLKTSLE